ncbi:JIP3 protein, partial [Polypterus senegalus]
MRKAEHFVDDLLHIFYYFELYFDLSDSDFGAYDLNIEIENKSEVLASADQSSADWGAEHVRIANAPMATSVGSPSLCASEGGRRSREHRSPYLSPAEARSADQLAGKCSNASSVSCAGTVWIGTQEGSNTKDHMIAGLANGTLAIFSRDTGGAWDLQCHHFVSVGSAPVQPIRCSLAIQDSLWCGYWNNIHIINMQSGAMERSISVSSRREQQVRFLCHVGSGVWVSCRLDSVLRLYDCQTSGQLLQEVDMMPLVTATLGDDGVDKDDGSEDALLRRAERSHMIIWQYSTPS